MDKKSAESKRKAVGIIGSGQFATAFSLRLRQAGYDVTIGSRQPDEVVKMGAPDGGYSVLGDVKIASVTDCVMANDVIIVAIHADHFKATCTPEVASACAGRVLVDVSNRSSTNGAESSNARMLAALVPDATIVKAFNTISAYVMENDSAGGSRRVPVASDDVRARAVVMEMAREIGFEPYENGALDNARAMEESVLKIFPEWRLAAALTCCVFVFWTFFALSRFYFATPGIMRWDQLPLKVFNKVFGASSLTLLSLTYLPSTCASFLQIVNGTKRKRFPGWVDAWLKSRRQLGVLAFWLICIHGSISAVVLSPTYMKAWFETSFVKVIVPANHTHDVTLSLAGVWMTWIGELSLLLGILAVALMAVLAISSFPSVTNAMSWAEWRLVQSQLGYVMLTLAVTHVYVMGVPKWVKTGFPLVFFRVKFLSIVFPTLVIVLRLVLLLPCLSAYVERIRRGWERKRAATPLESA